MDYAKAIEILKETAKSTRLLHSHLVGDNVPQSMKNSLDALEVAIDAVGKQIPRLVVRRKRDGVISYHCPECKEQIRDIFRYKHFGLFCENCGQRLGIL